MNLSNTFQLIKGPLVFLMVAVLVIVGAAVIVYGFGWIWNAVPFGLAALTLGFAILGATFYISKDRPAFKARTPIAERISRLNAYQTLGLLVGSTIVIAGVAWFFLPVPLLNAMPKFSTGLWQIALGLILLYGIGECVRLAVLSLRVYWLGSVLFFAISGIVFWFFNLAVWRFVDSFPNDYLVMGKILVGVCVLFQLAYLVFLRGIPAFAEGIEIAEQKNGS